MTTATKTSAFPVPVAELLPQARELAGELGRVPGRNKLMSELRIGAKKANEIIERLHDETAEAPNPGGLRLVPDTTAEPTGEESEPATAELEPVDEPESEPTEDVTAGDADDVSIEESSPAAFEPDSQDANPAEPTATNRVGSPLSAWPVLLLSLPAFVAIWSGWVGLGGLTGFGIVHPLPGIADGFALNTAITLPIGMETYAAYALRVWMSGHVPPHARRFAKYSALGSLALGALGQIAFHLMKAAGMTAAPWPITALVACLPVAVLGMGAALAHLIRDNTSEVPR